MMAASFDIVVAGHLCLDLIPKFPATGATALADILLPGKLVNIGECVVSTGGPVSNTGIALAKLGQKVTLMGKVGDDPFGHVVVERMKALGLGDGVLVIPGENTSYTVVVAPPGIDRVFLHHPGANDTYCSGDLSYEMVRGAKLFHLGYPPVMRKLYSDGGRELTAIFRRVKELGVTTALDMVLPDPAAAAGRVDWDAVLRETLPHVDLFLPSGEELLYFLDRELFFARRRQAVERGADPVELFAAADLSALAARALAYGAGAVMIKLGRCGLYFRTPGEGRLARFGAAKPADPKNWADKEYWTAAYHVEHEASATGAGDSAIAGFLASFMRGESLAEAVAYGAAAGAQNVTAYDALSGIKSYPETKAALAKGWPKKKLQVAAPGWEFDAGLGLWRGPA